MKTLTKAFKILCITSILLLTGCTSSPSSQQKTYIAEQQPVIPKSAYIETSFVNNTAFSTSFDLTKELSETDFDKYYMDFAVAWETVSKNNTAQIRIDKKDVSDIQGYVEKFKQLTGLMPANIFEEDDFNLIIYGGLSIDEIQLNNKIKNIVKDFSAKTEFEAVEEICEYIRQNYEYQLYQDNEETLIETKRGNCVALSKLAKRFLSVYGIDSDYVRAQFSDGVNHRFLLVKLNDGEYYCDPTWYSTSPESVKSDYALSKELFNDSRTIFEIMD